MFGYEPDEIIGQPVAILFTPEDVPTALPAVRKMRQPEGRAVLRTRDGICGRTARDFLPRVF